MQVTFTRQISVILLFICKVQLRLSNRRKKKTFLDSFFEIFPYMQQNKPKHLYKKKKLRREIKRITKIRISKENAFFLSLFVFFFFTLKTVIQKEHGKMILYCIVVVVIDTDKCYEELTL